MHSRRMTESLVIAMFILCAWFFIDAHFHNDRQELVEAILWLKDAAEVEQNSIPPEQEMAYSTIEEEAEATSSTWQHTTMLTHSTAAATLS